MAYVRDGAFGQPPEARSPVCAAAQRASRRLPHDTVSAALIELLERPIAAHQTALLARRADALRQLVDGLDVPQACRLRDRLGDRADPLAQFFDCELSPALGAELRARLERACKRPAPGVLQPLRPPTDTGWAPMPVPVPPQILVPGVPPPRRPVPPVLPRPDPWPLPDPRPAIPVLDLLERARQVEIAVRDAGLTSVTIAGLGAAITEVTHLVGLFSGLAGSLLFEAGTGALALRPFPPGTNVHLTEVQRRARAMTQPEWGRLQEALQRLHRLETAASEQLRDARGRFQPKRDPGDHPPGGAFEDEVCDRVARAFPFSARRVHVRGYAEGRPWEPPPRRLVLSDPKIVVDCIGSRWPDRGLQLFEAKSSGLPDFTNPGFKYGQGRVYARLQRVGGEIVADRGPYRAGTRLPAGTLVTIVTPANIDRVLPGP